MQRVLRHGGQERRCHSFARVAPARTQSQLSPLCSSDLESACVTSQSAQPESTRWELCESKRQLACGRSSLTTLSTLLEQVILRGLGRDSLPEWKPTRERRSYYPRNAGFKRAYAEIELERMIAAAKAKGLDEDAVDSIYLRRGTKEFEEFERRNGFDKQVKEGQNGLLMEQHKL